MITHRHAQRLASPVIPHPVKLKINANSYRHLTVGVNYDLSEKVLRKEQVHRAILVLEI